MKSDRLITVGKFGAPHGIQGWISLYSYTDPLENILNYQPWLVSATADQPPVQMFPQAHQWITDKRLTVKFPQFSSPEQARMLTNQMVYVLRSQLPALPQGEFYWEDLMGLEVHDLQGQALGRVIQLLEAGAAPVVLWVKRPDQSEFGIPFVWDEFIKSVDLETGVISVDWHE